MTVSLKKGQDISLTKAAPGIQRVLLGLGWDVGRADNSDFDLDASAFVLGADEKVLSESHFVFYNNTQDPSGAVTHSGDNLTGAGDGDNEIIRVDLAVLPPEAIKVVFVVTLYQAESRQQHFGRLRNTFIRAINLDNSKEIARYDLGSEGHGATAMMLGELYRAGPEWKFRAVGQGSSGGLPAIARQFGVEI